MRIIVSRIRQPRLNNEAKISSLIPAKFLAFLDSIETSVIRAKNLNDLRALAMNIRDQLSANGHPGLVLYGHNNGWCLDLVQGNPGDLEQVLLEVCLLVETQRIFLERQECLEKIYRFAYYPYDNEMMGVLNTAIEKGVLRGHFVYSDSLKRDILGSVELSPCFLNAPAHVHQAITKINGRLAKSLESRGIKVAALKPHRVEQSTAATINPYPQYPLWPEISDKMNQLIGMINLRKKKGKKEAIENLLNDLAELDVFSVSYGLDKKITNVALHPSFQNAPEGIQNELFILIEQTKGFLSLDDEGDLTKPVG